MGMESPVRPCATSQLGERLTSFKMLMASFWR